MAIKSDY